MVFLHAQFTALIGKKFDVIIGEPLYHVKWSALTESIEEAV